MALLRLWHRFFGGPSPRPEFRRYDHSDTKALENVLVQEAIEGKLPTWTHEANGWSCTERFTIVYGRDIVIRVDHPSSMPGSFTFLHIDGFDYSYMSKERFDMHRVVHAIQHKVDAPGKPNYSLLYL